MKNRYKIEIENEVIDWARVQVEGFVAIFHFPISRSSNIPF